MPAAELLRVIAVEHGMMERRMMGQAAESPSREAGAAVVCVVPDPARRLPGRGAHVHADPDCLAQAQRRRAFGRALRVSGVIDTGALAEYVARR